MTPSSESEGAEVSTSTLPSDPVVRAFIEAVDELYFAFELLDEHERWQRQEDNRQAYGDGENCDGACGLSVPDPGPEPALPDPDELADQLDVLVDATRSWERAPWTDVVAALGEASAAARAEGDPDARAIAAANRIDEVLLGVLRGDVADEPACWLGMRIVAADANRLNAALWAESEAAQLQQQIDYSMSEGDEDGSEQEAFMNELSDAMDRAGPVVERATELLNGGPSNAESAAAELQSLQEIVAPVLERRRIEDFQSRRDALRTVCGT